MLWEWNVVARMMESVVLNTSAGGLGGQKPMNRTPAPLNIQIKRVDVRGLRSGRASMSAF